MFFSFSLDYFVLMLFAFVVLGLVSSVLCQAHMRMVRWVCDVKVKDKVPSKELREILCIDDIISVLQQNRLQWYGRVLRKEDTDW